MTASMTPQRGMLDWPLISSSVTSGYLSVSSHQLFLSETRFCHYRIIQQLAKVSDFSTCCLATILFILAPWFTHTLIARAFWDAVTFLGSIQSTYIISKKYPKKLEITREPASQLSSSLQQNLSAAICFFLLV